MLDGRTGVLGPAALQLAGLGTKLGPEPALSHLISSGVDHATMLQPWMLGTALPPTNALVRAKNSLHISRSFLSAKLPNLSLDFISGSAVGSLKENFAFLCFWIKKAEDKYF